MTLDFKGDTGNVNAGSEYLFIGEPKTSQTETNAYPEYDHYITVSIIVKVWTDVPLWPLERQRTTTTTSPQAKGFLHLTLFPPLCHLGQGFRWPHD